MNYLREATVRLCEYVCECDRLHATIWQRSETLKYHTVAAARCQAARVPRWRHCVAKTFSPYGSAVSDATLRAIFHCCINAFSLLINKQSVDLFKRFKINSQELCSFLTSACFKAILSRDIGLLTRFYCSIWIDIFI